MFGSVLNSHIPTAFTQVLYMIYILVSDYGTYGAEPVILIVC